MNLVDENNVEVLRKFFHPGYMYVRDLEMLSPDKLIANLEEFASGVCSSINQVTHSEDDQGGLFSHDLAYNEPTRGFQKGDSTNERLVPLKKDLLFWCGMISTS